MTTATATRTTLREDLGQLHTGSVDTANAVIRGCKILGRESKNGRSYSDRALSDAARLYEGIQVNVDHPDLKTPGAVRPLAGIVGWLKNSKIRSGAVYADFHYLKSHPLAPQIIEAAERQSSLLGFSHNAEGATRMHNGRMLVEGIDRVRSVDLVSRPATTNGLFESAPTAADPLATEIDAMVLGAFHDHDLTGKALLARIQELRDHFARLQRIRMDQDPATKLYKGASPDDAANFKPVAATTAESFVEALSGTRPPKKPTPAPTPPKTAAQRFAESLRG